MLKFEDLMDPGDDPYAFEVAMKIMGTMEKLPESQKGWLLHAIEFEDLEMLLKFGEMLHTSESGKRQLVTSESENWLGESQIGDFLGSANLESDQNVNDEIVENLIDLDNDLAEIGVEIEVEHDSKIETAEQTDTDQNQTMAQEYIGKLEINDFFGSTGLKSDANITEEVRENLIDFNSEVAELDLEIKMEENTRKNTYYGRYGKIEIKGRRKLFHLNRLNRNGPRSLDDILIRKSYRPYPRWTEGKKWYIWNNSAMEHLVGFIDDTMVIRRDGLPWYVRRKRVRLRA